MPGMRRMKLNEANAPTAMNAAEPSESCPAYPVRMLRPIAASARISVGTRIAEKMYGDAVSGTTTNASARITAMPMRSWRIGKIAESARYVDLNCPASR
jgi:hypothetical protein